jgi:bifunctional N-acetylglucosamine-1-phosphate-uridyltransferase/glucosamine-1-phosphate-acetyltransferase GlmU-like protein
MNILLLMGDIQNLQHGNKPTLLHEVNGGTYLEMIVEKYRQINAKLIFILQDDTEKNFQKIIKLLAPSSVIINTANNTKGALCSALLAVDCINNNEPLLIANGHQFLDINLQEFASKAKAYDGAVVTFKSLASGWSYADVSPDGIIKYIAEKDIVSNNATAGCYFFQKSSFFVNAAMETIRNNNAVNDTFYIAPCYNEMLLKRMKIIAYQTDREKYFYFKKAEDVERFNQFVLLK